MRHVERAITADPDGIEPYVQKARREMTLGGDRAKARETARGILLRFGAERAATAHNFEDVIAALDSTDLVTLARVTPAVFGGSPIPYQFWRIKLFDGWNRERARAHADSLIRVGQPLMRERGDDYLFHTGAAWVYAVAGKKDSAVAEARRSLALMPSTRDAVAWGEAAEGAAKTFTRVGELDAAIDQLEHLLNAPSWISVPALRTDPVWTPLRGHPRFQRLLASRLATAWRPLSHAHQAA